MSLLALAMLLQRKHLKNVHIRFTGMIIDFMNILMHDLVLTVYDNITVLVITCLYFQRLLALSKSRFWGGGVGNAHMHGHRLSQYLLCNSTFVVYLL